MFLPVSPPRVTRFSVLRLCSLALVVSVVWIAHHGLWSGERWQVPLDYHADALEMLARIQAAAEGTGVPLRSQVVERLGAPFHAPWNDYPASDKLLVLGLGMLARSVGVGAAANIGLVFGLILAAVSFYGCARYLRIARPWAMAGALLFACSYGTFARGLAHMLLVFNWTIPPGLLVCGWVAGRTPLTWRSRRSWVALAVSAALGASNPYNLYFWLQLVGWAVVAQWFGARRFTNLAVGVGCIGAAFLSFLVVNAEVWLYTTDAAPRELVERNYGGTEKYALKPIELVIPPRDHRLEVLAFFGHRYARWSDWRGEAEMPYLGLVGIVGLATLLALAAVRALRTQRLPGPALQSVWLLGFATVGGLTNLLAFYAGLQIFRATNRVSFILLPIVLLFLVRQLSWLTVDWSRRTRYVVALGVVLVGLWDQVPRTPDPARRQARSDAFAADQAFAQELESALGHGARVFQLPVFGFLEAPDRHQLGGYEHLRLYLAGNDLHLSFGIPRFRAMNEWQHELETLPLLEAVQRLERSGFAAVVVGRRGYPDRARALLEEMEHLGYERIASHATGEWVALALHPAAQREWPYAGRFTLASGWHRQPVANAEGVDVWWSYEPAVLNYFNPARQPITADVRMRLQSAGAREVEIHLNRERVHQVALRDGEERVVEFQVAFQPGSNRVDLVSPQPPVRVSQQRRALRAVGLIDHTVRLHERVLVESDRAGGAR